ncbi:uncharacterized protein KY384_000931 [Bacidia gigantensis]|uniref:uncharacterized protein n=1 Tax=Bacidia gigantensis TaxID=2732470 RepID=UPI001D0387C4|nr:uncharacterized protein KY384_000931 [Bacidia gigantensis]KAG8534088.1 hypothetical protein KY384_000931 [Bacidia gigantensis]
MTVKSHQVNPQHYFLCSGMSGRIVSKCTAPLTRTIRARTTAPSRCISSGGRRQPYTNNQRAGPSGSKARAKQYAIPASAALITVLAGYAILRSSQPRSLDARPSSQGDALSSGAKVQITGQDHGDDVPKAPTGTSTIPYFPKSIWLPNSGSAPDQGKTPALPAGIGAAQEEEEYQLLGLGVRKVSLFRIEVYVVGIYVAKSDIAKLQAGLVKTAVGPGASTLVQGEKEDLRKQLLDGKGSERVWGEVLRQKGVRSAVRIVPVKNTNFGHLRDGWIRGIDARGKGEEYSDESFKSSVANFKAMMGGKGSVATGRTLLLERGVGGALKAWVEEDAALAVPGAPYLLTGKGDRMTFLGKVEDERVSRLVWLGYISGENPASEAARQSVVDGVIDLVERPIGTIETQVV